MRVSLAEFLQIIYKYSQALEITVTPVDQGNPDDIVVLWDGEGHHPLIADRKDKRTFILNLCDAIEFGILHAEVESFKQQFGHNDDKSFFAPYVEQFF